MTFAEAAKITKHSKALFKAFSEAEDFYAHALELETKVSQLEGRLKEVESLLEDRKRELADEEETSRTALQTLQDAHRETLLTIEYEHKALEERLAREHSEALQRHMDTSALLTAEVDRHREEVERWQSAIDLKTAEYTRVHLALEALKELLGVKQN